MEHFKFNSFTRQAQHKSSVFVFFNCHKCTYLHRMICDFFGVNFFNFYVVHVCLISLNMHHL